MNEVAFILLSPPETIRKKEVASWGLAAAHANQNYFRPVMSRNQH